MHAGLDFSYFIRIVFLFLLAILTHLLSGNSSLYIKSRSTCIFYNAKWTILNKIVKSRVNNKFTDDI